MILYNREINNILHYLEANQLAESKRKILEFVNNLLFRWFLYQSFYLPLRSRSRIEIQISGFCDED